MASKKNLIEKILDPLKISLLLITPIFFQNYLQNQDKKINFMENNFRKAEQKAEKENKIIFVNIGIEGCAPCRWMEKNVFKNDSVAEFYNQNFINFKVKGKSKEFGEINKYKEFKVMSFPAYIFLDSNGRLLHKKVGASNVADFILLGKEAMNPKERLSTLNSQYNEGGRGNDFLEKYVKKLVQADINPSFVLNDYQMHIDNEKKFVSKTTWDLIKIAAPYLDRKSRIAELFVEKKKEFEQITSRDSIENIIATFYNAKN